MFFPFLPQAWMPVPGVLEPEHGDEQSQHIDPDVQFGRVNTADKKVGGMLCIYLHNHQPVY